MKRTETMWMIHDAGFDRLSPIAASSRRKYAKEIFAKARRTDWATCAKFGDKAVKVTITYDDGKKPDGFIPSKKDIAAAREIIERGSSK